MNKIGFVNICHVDYLSAKVLEFAADAVTAISGQGIEIVQHEKPVTNFLQARQAATILLNKDVDGVVIFLGTWIECPVAMAFIREVEHLPICLWGFPMYMDNGLLKSTGSYVSFAMFRGSLARVQYRFIPILGMPDDASSITSARAFCRAAITARKLKRTRIGLVGYTSMGIYPGTFDHLLMRVLIGPEVEHIDAYSLINRISSIDLTEGETTAQEIAKVADFQPDVSKDQRLVVAKFLAALKKLADELSLDAVNIKCQYEFSKEFGMVACTPLSLLADMGIVSSCEGDIPNTVSMIILSYLTGTTVTYGDCIHHYENTLKLSSCGFLPFSMGKQGRKEVRRFDIPGFNGVHNSFGMKTGRVTILRLVEDIGTYHFLYCTGEGLETDLRQGILPALDVRLDGDIGKLVNNYSGQHFALCYGDASEEIESLSKILGIKTIRI